MSKRVRKTEIPPIVIELGNQIEAEIKKQDKTQKDIAHSVNMDVENLRKYIKGRQEMKISTLFRIAEALGIPASDLIKDLKG